MANFFKDYHAQLKAKREQEQAQKDKGTMRETARRDYIYGLKRGDRVKWSVLVYAGTDTPANIQTLYFADIISDNTLLLAEDKQTAKAGRGYFYDVCGVII